MNTKEAQRYLTEVCSTVITTFATRHNVPTEELNIRIDLENVHAKPVFALFHKSTFLAPSSLKEIIHAGGGGGFTLLISTHIKGIIRDIFKASQERFEVQTTKELFALLYLKDASPVMAIFCKGQFADLIPISEILEDAG